MSNEENIKSLSRKQLAHLIYKIYAFGVRTQSAPYCKKPQNYFLPMLTDEPLLYCPAPCDRCASATSCTEMPFCNEALENGYEACQRCIVEWLDKELEEE